MVCKDVDVIEGVENGTVKLAVAVTVSCVKAEVARVELGVAVEESVFDGDEVVKTIGIVVVYGAAVVLVVCGSVTSFP